MSGDGKMTIGLRSDEPDYARAGTDEVIRDSAIRWLLWLRVVDGAEDEFIACERWCARNGAHAAAMHEVLWLWTALRMLGVHDAH
ncbi:FecR/PupR family sigma factor regulator [Burkholderia gladioli]|uniref:FecR/PupR family sigma factor regulator n=2 Tax=Burkholderia gladioli TaxID=28095 RepID=UPI0016402782|nr:DUF4880 domain-containing protein [Burkholderia gladioli]